MSSKNDKESSLLAPVIGAYKPTDADADRIFAKIEAALDAPPPSRAPAAAPRGLGHRALMFAGVSCIAIAVTAGVVLRSGSPASDARTPAVATTASPAEAPRATNENATTEPGPAPAATVEATNQPPIASVSVEALPSLAVAPAPRPTAKKPAANMAPAAPQADTLDEEARLLADARRASESGAGERALALLDEHARRFSNGWLANERDAERVLVLCRLGRRSEATRAAAVFLEGRPKGPLTRRVEMSCAGAGSKDGE